MTSDDDPLNDLLVENEQLRQRLAIECMDATEEDKLLAHQLIVSLREELAVMAAEMAAIRQSRDSYMQENAELKRTVVALRKKLK